MNLRNDDPLVGWIALAIVCGFGATVLAWWIFGG
jgi:hypothetical protein